MEKPVVTALLLFAPAAVWWFRGVLLRHTECTREEAYVAAFLAGAVLLLLLLPLLPADPPH